MKRILMCGILMTISMFFTGCSTLITNLDPRGYQEIKWDVEDSAGGSWGSMGLGTEVETLPDYYEMNEDEKFESQEGGRAFQIKDGHSENSKELESFQIGTLQEDGTFIYAYVTKEDGTGENRRMVHCVSAYQYDTGRFRVLHETMFDRVEGEEEKESFYIQVCEDTEGRQVLFVYDNGIAYLYDSAGKLEFQTDVETFVREHFTKAYSASATNAITDGQDRIYVELMLEKEYVDLPADETAEFGSDHTSEEDADKEAEELDNELSEKTIEIALEYTFQSFSSTVSQYNDAFAAQTTAWKNAAEGKVFTSHPDAEADWETAVAQNPDHWGTVYLDDMELKSQDKMKLAQLGLYDKDRTGVPMLAWEGEKTFSYVQDGYVCTFGLPMYGYDIYEGFRDLEEGKPLQDTFVIQNDKYREVYGTVGTLEAYDPATISRSYTYQWYTTETNEKGETVQVEHQEVCTQSIERAGKRRAELEQEYLEGYRTLSSYGVSSLHGIVDHQLLASSDTVVFWLKDGETNLANALPFNAISVGEQHMIDVFLDQGETYLLITTDSELIIINQELGSGSFISNMKEIWRFSPQLLQAGTESLMNFTPTENDKKYVIAHEELEKSNMGSLANMIPVGHYDGECVRRVTLTSPETGQSSSGFLFTILNKGLVFVDTQQGQSICIKDGTWYGTWRRGDTLVSVGFADDGASYGTLDVAYSRVLEYDLDELYQEELNKAAEQEEKAKEESKRAEQKTTAAETTQAWESTASPLEQWQESKAAKDETAGQIDLEKLRDSVSVEREKIEETTSK